MSKSRDRESEKYILKKNGTPHLRVEITSENAMFTNPLYTEKVSYDVITPSAAEGALRNIYSHKGCIYKIDKIYVLNPIVKENIKCNYVASKLKKAEALRYYSDKTDSLSIDPNAGTENQPMNTLRLKDVKYIIDFHVEIDNTMANEGDTSYKFAFILADRLIRGQEWSTPYLGMREYPCDINILDPESDIPVSKNKGICDLGFMFYGWDRNWALNKMSRIMYHPVMKDGMIDVANAVLYREVE